MIRMRLPKTIKLQVLTLMPHRARFPEEARYGADRGPQLKNLVNRDPHVAFGEVFLDTKDSPEVEIDGEASLEKGLSVLAFADGDGRWRYFDAEGNEVDWAGLSALYIATFGKMELPPAEPPDSKHVVDGLVAGSSDQVVTETTIKLKET
jgi:hypothetical protein